MTVVEQLAVCLRALGFKEVAQPLKRHSECILLLKKQTLNINRAVAVVCVSELPQDLAVYVRDLRKDVAFRVGFFPFLYGLGLQVVFVANNDVTGATPARLVAAVDNQWAIVQSVFLVDESRRAFKSARSWGQFVTGKYQDAIQAILQREFREVDA